jgi:hypothetical protein
MPERRPLNIRVGRDPVEGWFLGGTCLGALAAISAPSPAINSLVPPWVLWVWYGNFAVWSLIALAGILPKPVTDLAGDGYRRLVRRLHLERVGAVGVSLNCVSYGAASVAFTGIHASAGALWLFGVAAGFAHRFLQLTHDLRLLRGVFDEGWEPVDPAIAEPGLPKKET